MKKAYVFRGSPASGKGTLTKGFLKLLKGKVAFLELDNFRWGFHLTNRDISEVTGDEHLFAYNNFLLMLESYCMNGDYTLVIEGLFSWVENGAHGNMNDIKSILEKCDFQYEFFYLQAKYETLWGRNNDRKYSVPKKEFDSLFKSVGKGEKQRETIIDVDNKTIKEALQELEKHL